VRRSAAPGSPPGAEALVAAVRAQGIGEPRLLAAIRDVPRAQFAPPALAERAWGDEPIPIGHGQVTTQPSLVARMVEALALEGRERVLEIGAGYGWQTALLARLAEFVWSVERWPDLAEEARQRLERIGADNVEVLVGDGTRGFAEHSPYDAIVVSAAYPSIPEPLAAQLGERGRLVQPLGPGGAEEVVLFEKAGGGLKRRRMLARAHFVRLYGRHAFAPEAGSGV
jgi:protein-L-isoaspartate(D-aspartate) O-methyltransferase